MPSPGSRASPNTRESSFITLAGAGLNIVPPAVCVMGFGTLTYGLSPRATPIVTYGLLGWSLLVELVGGIGALTIGFPTHRFSTRWRQRPPRRRTGGRTAPCWASGIIGGLIGATRLNRRDLQGD